MMEKLPGGPVLEGKWEACNQVLKSIARQQQAVGAVLESAAMKEQPFLLLFSDAQQEAAAEATQSVEVLMEKAAVMSKALRDELSLILSDPEYTACGEKKPVK